MPELPIKHAVSVVIENSEGKTLFVLRSAKKNTFPLVWSLPSCPVRDGISFTDAIQKIGEEKLSIALGEGALLREGISDRGDYALFMHVYRARIISGSIHLNPDEYIDMKWEDPRVQLQSMRVMGDCCRLYQEYLNL